MDNNGLEFMSRKSQRSFSINPRINCGSHKVWIKGRCNVLMSSLCMVKQGWYKGLYECLTDDILLLPRGVGMLNRPELYFRTIEDFWNTVKTWWNSRITNYFSYSSLLYGSFLDWVRKLRKYFSWFFGC